MTPEENKIESYRNQIAELKPVYEEKKQAYQQALLEFNAQRNNAINATDPKTVTDWSLNGSIYRDKVTTAMNNWINEGHKNEVDSMLAYLSQATGNNPGI